MWVGAGDSVRVGVGDGGNYAGALMVGGREVTLGEAGSGRHGAGEATRHVHGARGTGRVSRSGPGRRAPGHRQQA